MYGSVFVYSTQALSTCRPVSSTLENGLLLVLWLSISLLFLSFSILEILLHRHWSFISLAFLSCYPSLYLISSCSDIFLSYLVLTIRSLSPFGPFHINLFQDVLSSQLFLEIRIENIQPLSFLMRQVLQFAYFWNKFVLFMLMLLLKKLTSMWWYW